MNQINWTQATIFGLVALLVILVGGGCLVLLLASGGLASYGLGGPGWCPGCPGYGRIYGSGYGPGYGPFGMMGGFAGPPFGLLMMGAVIGVPVLAITLLVIGLQAWWLRAITNTNKEANR